MTAMPPTAFPPSPYPAAPGPHAPGAMRPGEAAPPDPQLLAARDMLLASLPNDKLRSQIAVLNPGGPYDWAQLFPKTAGLGTGGDIKRRVQMLQSVEPRLGFLLFPGERIEFVTRGALNSLVEQYFMGLWSIMVNRTLFLFTNMRLILLNCDGKGRAKTLMWQIPYDRMRKYGSGTFSAAVKIKTVGGQAFTFIQVPSKDRKRLKEYMIARLAHTQQQGLPFPSHADRDPLCCQCATPLPKAAPACHECGDQMMNPTTPALLSLMLPGLGHLYMGHRMMSMIEMFWFAILVANMVLLVAKAGGAGLVVAVPVILIANGIDSLVTLHVAKKGAMPKRLAWKAP